MDASDLRIFESVARTGAMNRAAAELNTVQSNVTARVKALEDELGQTLFERTNKGVQLTQAGERLMPYAIKFAGLLDDARRAVRDEGEPAGSLAIGSLETTAALRLTSSVRDFVAAHPKVDFAVKTGTSCELIASVRNRAIDGAFVCGPIDHAELSVTPYFREELVLLTKPSIMGLDEALADNDLRIIVLRSGCSYRLHLESWLARHGIVGTRVLEFGTLEAIISMVSAGLGVTFLPDALMARLGCADRVRCHTLPNGEGAVETVFIRRRDAYLTSALRAFLDLVPPSPNGPLSRDGVVQVSPEAIASI